MRRAAIVAPIRTAVGKYGGSLKSIAAGDLGAIVIKALISAPNRPERIDDVVFSQGYGVARRPASGAGRRWRRPRQHPRRAAGSALRIGPAAVIDAAMRIQTGAADVVIAGGVESMSTSNIIRWTTAGVRAAAPPSFTTG
jgi:acetyl-CoA C-acetyltransferase